MELGDYEIQIVEDYPCDSKEEMHKREAFWITNNLCVNKQIPGQTRTEYAHKYRARPENKERIRANCKNSRDKNKIKNRPAKLIRDKAYYDKNKARILEKNKTEKYTCECGSIIRKCFMSTHLKTDKHKYFLENGKNKFEGVEMNPNITCECGAIIKKYELRRHKKSKKHINLLQMI
jgi:hypothetical protein